MNISSENGIRKNYQRMLLIDDREPLSFIEKISENCSIPIDIRRLKTGDYISDDYEVGIERKTAKDFASSMISKKKRLWNQFDRLKKEFKYPYILISGKLSDLDMNVSNHAILGAIAYLATNGITVVKVDSDQDLVYLILKLMERHGKLQMPLELNGI